MPKKTVTRRFASFVIVLAAFCLTTTPAFSSELDECKQTLRLGVQALDAAEKVSTAEKKLREQDLKTIQTLLEQRNKAIESSGSSSLIPWYFYVLVGAAGATVLIRGVK
jgi:hypothetical protein